MANPTIGATTPRIQYTATASQTVFTVPFEFLANADLAVYVNGTLKTLTTDYTLTGANTTGGGSLTFVTGRTAGDIVTILGNLAYSRDTNKYTKYGLLPAEVLEADFDAVQVQAKQLARDGQFALRAPLTDTGSPAMTLPVVATRASKALGFDASGNPIASSSTVTAIDAAVTAINTIAGASSGSSASISHIASGTGAQATTVQAKLREVVSVKDFGAVGDGVTDDTAAIIAAWQYVTQFNAIQLGERASRTLYFPAGIYLVTQNYWLNTATITPGYTGKFYTIAGQGMGQSIVVFKPTAANAYVYDQTQASSPAFVGLEFKDMELRFDNSANGSAAVHGFKVNAVSGAATQAFVFNSFRFVGVSSTVFLYLGGNVNASENKFINCRFTTLSTLIDIQNSEAVNHTLLATDVEDVYGHIFVTKQAGNINWFSGSVIFGDSAASECSIINLGGNVPATGTYTSSSHIFMGLRAEFRAQYSRAIYVTDNNVPVPVTFMQCNFSKVDYNQDFAKVTVANHSYIAFRDCTLPQSSTGSKFRFVNNPSPSTEYTANGLIKSFVLFDRCRSGGDVSVNEPYADFSQVTDSDIYQGQVVEYVGCENIPDAPSYGLRYRTARTYSPVNGKLVPFRGYQFPHGDGSAATGTANYFNLTIPSGAFVEEVQVSRATFAAHSTVDYQVELVDEAEFNTPGSGTIYGTMPIQKYDLAINWSVALNKRFTGTAAQRTIWLRLKTGVTATSSVGSEYGVVFAKVF